MAPQQKQHYHQPTTSLRHVGDQRYLVQQWTGGTECDLTGKPRSIEIQVKRQRQALFLDELNVIYGIVSL